MNPIIIIPARLKSTRLKEKLLQKVEGKTILQYTYECAKKTKLPVYIATDSEKIKYVGEKLGAKVILTKEAENGTQRVIQAVKQFRHHGYCINVQADMPNVDPQDITLALQKTYENYWDVGSAFYWSNIENNPNKVKVVTDNKGQCLYFSRSNIPYGARRQKFHIGVYIHHSDVLRKLENLKSPIHLYEENLEQLSWISNGLSMGVVEGNETISIDTESDLTKFKKYIIKNNAKKVVCSS